MTLFVPLPQENALVSELRQLEGTLGIEVSKLLDAQDGGPLLAEALRTRFRPEEIAGRTPQQRMWEVCALRLRDLRRFYDALIVLNALYAHMLTCQQAEGRWVHKGMPLVWMSDLHLMLNHPVLAKRYVMLTLCEDAINDEGRILRADRGVYFRLAGAFGLPPQQIDRYGSEAWRLYQERPVESRFPEWILQEFDQDWMTEYPSQNEAALYDVNTAYISWLLSEIGASSGGGSDGRMLERLAQYLLGSMVGCRALRRRRSPSTDYDVVCTLDGVPLDFRSELGRYFVCECKDWKKAADFTVFAKFCRVLDSTKSRFGILFSKQGITGGAGTSDATREQLKVYQDRGVVIVVVTEADLSRVANGENFVSVLRRKYEEVRLDLQVADPARARPRRRR